MNDTKQPEALRLADSLDLGPTGDNPVIDEAAAELRRQHALIADHEDSIGQLCKEAMDFVSEKHAAEAQHLQELRAYALTAQNLRAELVAEAARTAEATLRANQMTEQHRMQCNLRQELEVKVESLQEEISSRDSWLAECRDAFGLPAVNTELDHHFCSAMTDPGEVPAYVVAQAKSQEAQLSAIGAGGVESLRKLQPGEFEAVNCTISNDPATPGVLFSATAAQPPRECLQQSAGSPDWWRKRADEIELQVARSGSKEAMRCYTDMRTLLQAAAVPAQEHATQLAGQGQEALLDRAGLWIAHAQHGENCFLSDHYEGDPGSGCNCGKDALLDAIGPALEAAPAQAQEDAKWKQTRLIGALGMFDFHMVWNGVSDDPTVSLKNGHFIGGEGAPSHAEKINAVAVFLQEYAARAAQGGAAC